MKKLLSIVKKATAATLIALAIVMMVFTIISTFFVGQADKNIVGFRFFTVLSDSMSDTFKSGDVIICKQVDPQSLKPGDIITFKSTNPSSYGQIVTHKIRDFAVTENNQLAFVTYGTTTNSNDESLVEYSKIIGKYQFKMAGTGNFFQFLKTPTGYFLFIFIPLFLLVLFQIKGSYGLYKKLKAERVADQTKENESALTAQQQTTILMEEIKVLTDRLNRAMEAAQNEENNSGN